MTGRSEVELTLDRFLADGPETVADRAVEHTLAVIDRTKQRRDLLAPWRFSLMSINSRLATMMLVAAVAIGGGAYLLGQRSGVGPAVPTPTALPATPQPTPTAAPTPTPPLSTAGWIPFKSASYGFTVSHPSGWSEVPGTGRWTYAKQDGATIDTLWSPSGWPEFQGFETPIPAGMTAETFLAAFTADAVKTACYPLPNQWVQTTVDGHPASIAYAGCNEHFYSAEGIVVIGKQVWIFDLYGPDRSLIVPFLSTVKLDPTKVVD